MGKNFAQEKGYVLCESTVVIGVHRENRTKSA